MASTSRRRGTLRSTRARHRPAARAAISASVGVLRARDGHLAATGARLRARRCDPCSLPPPRSARPRPRDHASPAAQVAPHAPRLARPASRHQPRRASACSGATSKAAAPPGEQVRSHPLRRARAAPRARPRPRTAPRAARGRARARGRRRSRSTDRGDSTRPGRSARPPPARRGCPRAKRTRPASPRRSAFSRATASAARETSVAVTCAFGRSLASASATAPEPVPMSRIRSSASRCGQQLERGLDQRLGLGARRQHVRRHRERQRPELLAADQLGHRHALVRAPAHQLAKARALAGGDRLVELEVEPQAIDAERVGEQALRVEPRGLDPLLREVLGGPAQQLEDGPAALAARRCVIGALRAASARAAISTWIASSSSSRSPSRIASSLCRVTPAR